MRGKCAKNALRPKKCAQRPKSPKLDPKSRGGLISEGLEKIAENCGKIAENCGKIAEIDINFLLKWSKIAEIFFGQKNCGQIAKNCGKLQNCGKLWEIANIYSPHLYNPNPNSMPSF